ncbi:MAG TPA: hypothetical protein VFO31_14420 [Vicinamibacterales bacterium]|nr:hypothetical protein [Vicinamibacterales bacterium]
MTVDTKLVTPPRVCWHICAALAGLLAGAAAVEAQSLELRIEAGRVFLQAEEVSTARILERWKALTGVQVTGLESLTDQPVSLVLTGVSEREALGVLLRETVGYVLVAGAVPTSTIGRILISPGLAVRAASTPPAPAQPEFAALTVSQDGAPQTGLGELEQRLVDIAEGLIDQEASPGLGLPVNPEL